VPSKLRSLYIVHERCIEGQVKFPPGEYFATLLKYPLLEHPCDIARTPVSYCCTTFRLRNDLYCVGWGVKLYSLTAAPP